MGGEGPHQPAGGLALSSCFTGRVRKSQKPRRLAPALVDALQLRLVELRDPIKLLELTMAFRNRFAHFVQTVRSHRQRDVFTLVTSQQQAHVHVMIEVVAPAFLKTWANELSSPEVAGLRRAIRPRQAVRSRARHYGVNQPRLVAVAEHDRVAANPLALGVLSEVAQHRIEGTGQVNVVAVDEGENVARGSFETLVDRVHLAAILF